MSAAEHKMKSLHRDELECTCGWTDDADHSVQESIDALMQHAYEIGALEATEAERERVLDAVTDEPAHWAAVAAMDAQVDE